MGDDMSRDREIPSSIASPCRSDPLAPPPPLLFYYPLHPLALSARPLNVHLGHIFRRLHERYRSRRPEI